MNVNHTLPVEIRDIDYVWEWYEDNENAIFKHQNEVLNLFTNNLTTENKFFGRSREDIINHFREQISELERIICFNLVASSEAQIMNDFKIRVAKNKKDVLTKEYKKLKAKKRRTKISLDEDILSILKHLYPDNKQIIGDFNGILNYRHWFAHGRHWEQNIGRYYAPDIVYSISSELLKLVGIIYL